MTTKPTTNFGLTKDKQLNFTDWYHQTINKADMIAPYSIKGLTIFKPKSMFIWNKIKNYINMDIDQKNVEECYFPMLIDKEALQVEKSHLENFEPEVAWITHSGNTKITPLAVRPTSEAIIYPYISKMITHKMLPYKINQWCNVLRWEVKSCLPFIRNKEFLWQEGHCVYETKEECDKEVEEILDLYYNVYKDLLAVHTIKGRKSVNETFGGADYTLSIEAYIKEAGRAVQAATSHSLGTNFSKMFDIKVNDKLLYQSSWGLTTRSIGVAVMTHGDDIGLVLSPRVANIQIMIIPCGKINDDLRKYIERIECLLQSFRVKTDWSTDRGVGFKMNECEISGIPLRIEVGKKDMETNGLVAVLRHDLCKRRLSIDCLESDVNDLLDEMHSALFERSKRKVENCIQKVTEWNEFIKHLNENNMLLASWCGVVDCEEKIKSDSRIMNEQGEVRVMGAKSLNIPLDMQNEISEKCFKCSNRAICNALFGRSY